MLKLIRILWNVLAVAAQKEFYDCYCQKTGFLFIFDADSWGISIKCIFLIIFYFWAAHYENGSLMVPLEYEL